MYSTAEPKFLRLCWEVGIKSTKHHLKRIISVNKYTYEELLIILSQFEGILNSRSLTPLTSNPEDISPLTPGHFLIAWGFIALPDPVLTHVPENRLTKFQKLQAIISVAAPVLRIGLWEELYDCIRARIALFELWN